MGVYLLPSPASLAVFLSSLVTLFVHPQPAIAITRHYKFDVMLQNVTRLCHTKSMVTVNGKFPGPCIVAREGDRLLIKVVNHVQNNITVGLGTNPCSENQTCQGPNGTRFAASVNNVSFVMPTKAVLEAHHFGQSNGAYSPNFPINPLIPFNYTGTPPNNTMVSNGRKLVVLPFNSSVELIMQDTSILGAESHPLHLHGFNFFVVGQGFGNFDPKKDPANFNLVDPLEAGLPYGF